MQDKFDQWFSNCSDEGEFYLRFLKNGEYAEQLNAFFELDNRIPVAITASGSLVYAEVFENEVLFSIVYMDQNLDFHLANSIEAFEQLLSEKQSRDYFLHIACCPIGKYDWETFSKESRVPALESTLRPLEVGEIYGFQLGALPGQTAGRSVSHWVSPRGLDDTVVQNAGDYFSKIIDLHKARIAEKSNPNIATDIWDNRHSDYSGHFLTSYNVEKELENYPPEAIKSVYKSFGGATLSNLRSFSQSTRDYLNHTKHLHYYSDCGWNLAKRCNAIFGSLKGNNELLHITIKDEAEFGGEDSFGEKGVLNSFTDISSFPLLRSLKLINLTVSAFPQELLQLKELSAIAFLRSDMKDLPSSFAGLSHLSQLHISEGDLDGKTDGLSDLKNLEYLTLSDCGLKTIPAAIEQMKELCYLDLSGNPLESVPAWVGSLSNLKILSLENCGLETLPAELAALENIDELILKNNAFAALPESLVKLKTKVKIEPQAKALYDEKTRKKLEKDGKKPAKFKDFNFKLMVVQALMYDMELLKPKFDVHEFVKSYKKRKIDIEGEGYDPIPEVSKYFEDLEIPKILLQEITEMDGGMDVYHSIAPLWDGEDGAFDVKNAKDAKNLPNLKRVFLMCFDSKRVINQFEKLGVEVDY